MEARWTKMIEEREKFNEIIKEVREAYPELAAYDDYALACNICAALSPLSMPRERKLTQEEKRRIQEWLPVLERVIL